MLVPLFQLLVPLFQLLVPQFQLLVPLFQVLVLYHCSKYWYHCFNCLFHCSKRLCHILFELPIPLLQVLVPRVVSTAHATVLSAGTKYCFNCPHHCSKCWYRILFQFTAHTSVPSAGTATTVPDFTTAVLCVCRKVWPLELLAFIASCHALNSNYQRWVDTFNEKQLPRKNIVNKDTTCNSARATGHEANIFSSAKTVQEDVQQSDVEALHTDGTRNGHILQCPNLSHAFQCHIKPKKRYEIDVMSKVL